jgi:hypothetical protein
VTARLQQECNLSEPKLYRPGVNSRPRRVEKVILPGGETFLWVREMSVADTATILERSERPNLGNGVGGGHSTGRGVVVQIMMSCYDGDENAPGDHRLFTDADFGAIYDMPFSEFDVIYAAINRVNGKDATEQERLKDFLAVTTAASSS